ncbi:sugar phosphate isomerase/epimerase family protein [Bacteroidota bacterium]
MATRRNFLKSSGLVLASGMVPFACQNQTNTTTVSIGNKLPLGIASYSFRKYSLDESIQMTKRLGIEHLALKSMHMPLDWNPEQIKEAADRVSQAGINLYGAGVVYMTTEEEVNQAFEYAKNAGMKVIIGVPNHELLDLTEEKILEYDIIVAIHNHGPGDDLYPSPESVYEKIKNRDPRFGLCMDIGHSQRIGLDPAKEAEKYMDRLLDVHIKDVSASTAEGKTLEIGRGVIDIPSFLSVLIKSNYAGIVSFEYEKDEDDVLPGISESIGYVRGVLDTL